MRVNFQEALMSKSKREKKLEADLRDRILPLTPTRRLDVIIGEEARWASAQHILEAHGIALSDLEARKTVLAEREKVKAAQKEQKRQQELKKLRAKLRTKTVTSKLAKLSMTLDLPEPGDTAVLKVDLDPWLDQHPPVIRREAARAIVKLLKGFKGAPYELADCKQLRLTGSAKATIALLDRIPEIKDELSRIADLQSDLLGLLNRTDAITVAQTTKPVFDDAVANGHLRVADTVEFRKWGQTLKADQFDIRDIEAARLAGVFTAIQTRRKKREAERRKKGAEKAVGTRQRRESIRNQIQAQDRSRVRASVAATGDLKAGLALELFTWAQRASRLAKTSPSKKNIAYGLKDQALSCLFDADQLALSFVDGHGARLQKCKDHRDGWYPYEEIQFCSRCRYVPNHYMSLYAATLRAVPSAGTLHMPYPLGHAQGWPSLKEMPAADHHRDVAYGRSLDEDETAIFPLKRIRTEIARLVARMEAFDVEPVS